MSYVNSYAAAMESMCDASIQVQISSLLAYYRDSQWSGNLWQKLNE